VNTIVEQFPAAADLSRLLLPVSSPSRRTSVPQPWRDRLAQPHLRTFAPRPPYAAPYRRI